MKIDKKIKILHVLDSLGGGGVEEWVKNISILCDKNTFQFKIYFCGFVYDRNFFDYSDELKNNGIEVVYRGIDLSRYKNKLEVTRKITNKNYALRQIRRLIIYMSLNFFSFFQLINMLRHNRFDIIHIHLYRLFISGSLVGKLFRVPVVHTVPGLKSQYDSYQPIIYSIYKYFGSLADIFVTGASKSELIRYANVPQDKVRFIRGSIDLNRMRLIKRLDNPIISELNLYNSFPILLSVGRMDPEKGHIYSINSVAELKSRFPKIKLIILGDGSQLEDMRTLVAKLGLGEYIALPGFRKDIDNFHSLADIYLRTSIYEGANMASLLAMAYAKPVIGFDTKADTEVIADGENGILITPKNTNALIEAVSILANNRETRERLGRGAKEYVYNNYNIINAILSYENIYKTLFNKRHKNND